LDAAGRDFRPRPIGGIIPGPVGKKDKKHDDDRDDGDADDEDGSNGEVIAVHPDEAPDPKKAKKLKKEMYERELDRLHIELAKLQSWVKATGQKIVILFEGRDAAGKGGTIKCITEPLNPRIARVVALGTPTDREKSQWYFQRYVEHLPAAGEMVLFDRSWYNRAGVERVMGFATEEQVQEFLHSVPQFERMLVRSGIKLIKYWFSVSPDVQEKRFQSRSKHPTKRWKISPMDLEARLKWDDYSRAKDEMFAFTDIKQAPWYVVEADDKMRARLNCMTHLLSLMPYEDHIRPPLELPPRPTKSTYVRPPYEEQNIVPRVY
jgi:polyphosphate kinase 2